MKRQMLFVGFLAAAFLSVTVGLAFAGDRNGPRHRGHHWKGKHHAPHHAKHHVKRGHHSRSLRPHWEGRTNAPRYRFDRNGSHHRPGYRAQRHRNGDRNSYRHGWQPKPSMRQRPGKYAHRPPGRTPRHGHPTGKAIRGQHDGDRGPDRDRHAVDRDNRRGGRGDHSDYASNGTESRRGNRDGTRRSRQL